MCYLEKLNDYRGSVLTAPLSALTAMSVVVDTYSVDTKRSTEPKGPTHDYDYTANLPARH